MKAAVFCSGEKAKNGANNQKLWDAFNRQLMRRKKEGVAKRMVTLEDNSSLKKRDTDWRVEL